MAKGLGLIGNYSGKVGNTIGYYLRNSKNKQTQGIRIYQPVVRNPQTTLQMQQRIKIAAVSNLYRQFKSVIRRSMENQEYGDASRRAWLRQALGSQYSAGPWVVKGTTQAFPIPDINMSVGSLPDINMQLYSGGDSVTLEITRDSATAVASVATIGELSSYLIEGGNVMEGDQVTILAGRVSEEFVNWGPVRSFYVSTASSTTLQSIGLSFAPFDADSSNTEGDIYVDTSLTTVANAVCLITSRDGDTQHLRNTARWTLSTGVQAFTVYNPLFKSTAIDSYRTQSSSTEDWQVTRSAQGGDTVTVQTLGGNSVVLISLTQVGNYLQAVADDGAQYFVKINWARSTNYENYIANFFSSTETPPAGATNDNTVGTAYGSTSAIQDSNARAFTDWFVRLGGSISAVI